MIAVYAGNCVDYGVAWRASTAPSAPQAVRPLPPSRAIANAPLDALDGSGMESAFHAWTGRSGRRYVFTVAPSPRIDDEALRDAVVVCARRGRDGRRHPVFVGEAKAVPPDLRTAGPSMELHYHLLAVTAGARVSVIADLLGDG